MIIHSKILKVWRKKCSYNIMTLISLAITGIILFILRMTTHGPGVMQLQADELLPQGGQPRHGRGGVRVRRHRHNTLPAERPVKLAGAAGTATWGRGSGAGGRRAVLTRDVYVAGHSRPHPELCPSLGARLKVAILVTSAPSHRRARDAIRMTWGHFAMRSDVAFAFVLGAPLASMRTAILEEDALYGDIVLGHSLDSYSNLTLKTISMLEWMDSYCTRAPWLLKTDDDVFINVPKLLEFVTAPHRANASLTIWGKISQNLFPTRVMRSKYYASPLEFRGRIFPNFTLGPAYLMTADVIRPILVAAPGQVYLRLEDVFITGLLAERLGIQRRLATAFRNTRTTNRCVVQRVISIHRVRYHEQFDLWRKLLDGRSRCTRVHLWSTFFSNKTRQNNLRSLLKVNITDGVNEEAVKL